MSEGTFKLCSLDSKGKEFETIHLFVFNDSVLYTKKQSTSAYRYKALIPLGAGTRVKEIPDMGGWLSPKVWVSVRI